MKSTYPTISIYSKPGKLKQNHQRHYSQTVKTQRQIFKVAREGTCHVQGILVKVTANFSSESRRQNEGAGRRPESSGKTYLKY